MEGEGGGGSRRKRRKKGGGENSRLVGGDKEVDALVINRERRGGAIDIVDDLEGGATIIVTIEDGHVGRKVVVARLSSR